MVFQNWRILKVVLHLIYSDEIDCKENNATSYRGVFISYDVVFYLYMIYGRSYVISYNPYFKIKVRMDTARDNIAMMSITFS